MSSTVITSGLGVVFWAAAARWYTPNQVGLSNAALSGATLLATVSQLSLGSVFVRYLPRAGRHSNRILRRVYLIVIALSVVLGGAAALLWSSAEYIAGAAAGILFVAGVLSLALFAIQDAALLGLGKSRVVPIENALFAMGKLVGLPLLVGATLFSGIFAAWILAAVLSVLVVSSYVLLWLGPAKNAAPEHVPLPPRDVLWPQVIGQFASTVSSQIGILVVPLIVTARLGATENGYLTMAWLIATSFNALFSNVVQSFTYHVRKGNAVTSQSFRRFAILMLGLGFGGGAIVVIAAPWILDILAPGYQSEATLVLRLIGLSLPLTALWEVTSAFWWLENRLFRIAGAFTLNAVITLVVTWLLIPGLGIEAAGVALVAASAVIGLGFLTGMPKRLAMIHRGEGARWIAAERN